MATQQRAATLRLLQAVLVPQLSPFECVFTAATATTFTLNAEVSANTPVQLTFDGQPSQLSNQRPEAHEAESTTPEATPDQQIGSTEILQQCQQKLLAKLLRAIPNVLKSAVHDLWFDICAACNQQPVSQANAPPASEGSAQSVSDAKLQNDVEAPQKAAQQNAEPVVIDGDAMHALLGLMLHVAGNPALSGMEALLEFPQALADAMPDLLDVPTQALPPILAPPWTFGLHHTALHRCTSKLLACVHSYLALQVQLTGVTVVELTSQACMSAALTCSKLLSVCTE